MSVNYFRSPAWISVPGPRDPSPADSRAQLPPDPIMQVAPLPIVRGNFLMGILDQLNKHVNFIGGVMGNREMSVWTKG